jgi:hypothetical protein
MSSIPGAGIARQGELLYIWSRIYVLTSKWNPACGDCNCFRQKPIVTEISKSKTANTIRWEGGKRSLPDPEAPRPRKGRREWRAPWRWSWVQPTAGDGGVFFEHADAEEKAGAFGIGTSSLREAEPVLHVDDQQDGTLGRGAGSRRLWWRRWRSRWRRWKLGKGGYLTNAEAVAANLQRIWLFR